MEKAASVRKSQFVLYFTHVSQILSPDKARTLGTCFLHSMTAFQTLEFWDSSQCGRLLMFRKLRKLRTKLTNRLIIEMIDSILF